MISVRLIVFQTSDYNNMMNYLSHNQNDGVRDNPSGKLIIVSLWRGGWFRALLRLGRDLWGKRKDNSIY